MNKSGFISLTMSLFAFAFCYLFKQIWLIRGRSCHPSRMPRPITPTETLTIPDIHKNRIEWLLYDYTLLHTVLTAARTTVWHCSWKWYIARATCRLVSLNICLQITNKSHGRVRWFQKWTKRFHRMRRKIVNAMLPITCMSVLLLLLLFCYETVKCAGVSRTERKRAEQ